MKKYSFLFVLTEIIVLLVISCIPTVFVALYTDPARNLAVPAQILSMFTLFIIHISLANSILFPLAKRTMRKGADEEGFVSSHTFYNKQSNSCASVLVIDETHGRIAYVSVHNPFKFQTADVKDLSDIRSDYKKGPVGGTRYVYYQFTYRNKRTRIPTFTARNMHMTTSAIVREAIAKADKFRDVVQKLQ